MKGHSFSLPPDSIVSVDRAYIDFKWLYSLSTDKVFFVTRAKSDFAYYVSGQHKGAKGKRVKKDEVVSLAGFYAEEDYPEELRRIEYYDEKTGKSLVFLTNNFKLAPSTIAAIYKSRWQIELFFKWIKQNLKIKSFLGTSKNAVMSQVWVAMCYYLLLAYIKYQTKYKSSLLELSRVIRETLMERKALIDVLTVKPERLKKVETEPVQASLF